MNVFLDLKVVSIFQDKNSPQIINFIKFYFLFSYIKLDTYLITSKNAFILVILRTQLFIKFYYKINDFIL